MLNGDEVDETVEILADTELMRSIREARAEIAAGRIDFGTQVWRSHSLDRSPTRGPRAGRAGTLGAVTDAPGATPREQLLTLVRDLAVVHGRVTLSSGKEADYYVDLRRVTLHHRAAPLIGHLMLDMLEVAGLGTADVDAVGGLTLGADPVATSLLHAAASRGQDLDAFVVRKEAKAHGMQRRIEGPDVAGRRVVVVEDTSTTGGSPVTAVQAVREAGGEVVGVATIVDRGTGAREVIEALGVPYHHLFDLSDLGLS